MGERLRLMDAVCIQCKHIVSREDVTALDDASIVQTKAEIVRDGLVPYDYWTDAPKPVTGHANKCPQRPL